MNTFKEISGIFKVKVNYQDNPVTRVGVGAVEGRGIHHEFNTGSVKWSKGGNSYVIVPVEKASTSDYYRGWKWTDRKGTGHIVALISINGIGEIRWDTQSPRDASQDSWYMDGLTKEEVTAWGLTPINS